MDGCTSPKYLALALLLILVYYNSFFILVCSPNTYACKGVFNPNIPIFPPNSAEGLHFSAFHYVSSSVHNCGCVIDGSNAIVIDGSNAVAAI